MSHDADAAAVQESLFNTLALPRRTEASYLTDWKAFVDWACASGVESLPATPDTIARYGRTLMRDRKPSTILRALSSIQAVHRDRDCPLKEDRKNAVGRLRKELRELRDAAQSPTLAVLSAGMRVVYEHLAALERGIMASGTLETLRSRATLRLIQRDRAMIFVTFAAALKACELHSMAIDQIAPVEHGLMVRVGGYHDPSRTRDVLVPTGFRGSNAVEELLRWVEMVGDSAGPIWRPISRAGEILPDPLTERSIREAIETRLCAAGLDSRRLTSHSLRSGSMAQGIIRGESLEKVARDAKYHPASVEGLRRLEYRAVSAKPIAKHTNTV